MHTFELINQIINWSDSRRMFVIRFAIRPDGDGISYSLGMSFARMEKFQIVQFRFSKIAFNRKRTLIEIVANQCPLLNWCRIPPRTADGILAELAKDISNQAG